MSGDRFARERAFFAAYDAATNPLLVGRPLPPERLEAVVAVGRTLVNRVGDRQAGRTGAPRRGPHDRWVRLLSTLQLDLYRAHFGLPGGGLDYGPLGDAFLRFANGDLRDAEGSEHGQPNGPGALLFAEFALLARDWRLPDWAVWRPLLPALVSMGRVWARAYQPPAGRLWEWSAWTFHGYRSDARYSDEELAGLREGYAALAFDDEAERALRALALQAFRAPIPQA